ncbi:coproporphyrinogen III oxidase [Thermoanaerobacterium thermosaccharolyticum]|nr:coproporphyrinogen III oxidase [Thermoanaerobacterium thermosaccharolyticum]
MIRSGIYIHIPFCKRKCYYCDFNSYANMEKSLEPFKDAIMREIRNRKDELKDIFTSIYIGGGTPNVLPPFYIENILDEIYKYYDISNDAEISIELNPGLIDDEKLKTYKRIGINRISIGLQAWQDKLLKKIGRIHTIHDFIENYDMATKYFDNINIDIMYALPDQIFDDFKETLSNVVSLKPTHISCYGLILEEGTVFYKLYEENKIKPADDEFEMMMYHYGIEFLQKNGYKHYEISNYAIPGYECRHNTLYWKDLQYIGFGPGAYSFVNNRRCGNVKDIKKYIEMMNRTGYAIEDIDVLDEKDKMSEYMFLGLRMMDGVYDKDFKTRFGKSMFSIFKNAIDKNIGLNLLIREGDNIKLTQKGIDVSNNVFEDFLF